MNPSEVRTIEPSIDRQASLPGMDAQGWGLGSDASPSPAWWGGYPDVCTDFEFSEIGEKKIIRDPRLDDLAAMGLQRAHLDVAAAVGVDNFIVLWKIYDADQRYSDDADSRLRVCFPRFSLYNRFQRNRYAELLFRAGKSVAEVSQRIEKYMCEKLTERHVLRLRKKL